MAILIDMTDEKQREVATAIVIKSGLALYWRSKGKLVPARGWTLKAMLEAASRITKRRYKRSLNGAEFAYLDLERFLLGEGIVAKKD